MTNKSRDNNVVVIKSNTKPDNNNKVSQSNDANNNTKINDAKTLQLQVKIFAILLMSFSTLLFLALVSHTSKDASNLQLDFLDWFGIFSGDADIKIKFDTTFNWLSLFGAFMSDLLINRTLGFWIIGLPVFLFAWGWKYYKYNEIPTTTIFATIYYLIIAFFVACMFGSLSNFDALQNISIEFYGVIGAFVGTTISNVISPVGSIILILLLLLFFVAKITNAKQKGITNIFKSLANFLNINNILDFINNAFTNYKQTKTQKNKDNTNPNNISDAVETTTISEPENTTTLNETNTNEMANYADNIFLNNQSANNNYTEKLHKTIPITPISDDNLLDNFSPQIKPKINENVVKPITIKQPNYTIPPNESMLNEAGFTFEPPQNLPLPPQKIYPPTPIDISNETITRNNTPDNQPEENIEPPYHQPIKIELNNKPNQNTTISPQMQKTFVNETQPNLLRNSLSVEIHDEKINYTTPTLNLLKIIEDKNIVSNEELHKNGRILQEKLQTFKIDISDLTATRGPVVTQYEFVPADGVKINKIEVLADDLAMALKTKSVIISPLPEKGSVGIQIPNSNPSIVSFRSVVESADFQQSHYELPLALGKTVSGEPYIADLAKMPHLLMAGATGSGKSVGINTIIASLLYKKKPHQLKFIIVDPKKVELSQYTRLSNHFIATLPNLNSEIVTDPKDAVTILKSAVLEMEKRYTILESAKQRNIKDYNEKVRSGAFQNDTNIDHREFPYIVVIIDELADLMLTAGKEVEKPIVRLAQMARAVGIHLIIATQRPSVNVITGIIKANFPARIAYLVAQKIDSRVILDDNGAEALLGNGDMLFNSATQKALRIQSPFISTDEVESICDFIGNQEGYSAPYFLPFVSESGGEDYGEVGDINGVDPLFYEAAELVINMKMASISGLQRSLKIGFARAGRIIDELAKFKVIGPQQGSKARAVLVESINDIQFKS